METNPCKYIDKIVDDNNNWSIEIIVSAENGEITDTQILTWEIMFGSKQCVDMTISDKDAFEALYSFFNHSDKLHGREGKNYRDPEVFLMRLSDIFNSLLLGGLSYLQDQIKKRGAHFKARHYYQTAKETSCTVYETSEYDKIVVNSVITPANKAYKVTMTQIKLSPELKLSENSNKTIFIEKEDALSALCNAISPQDPQALSERVALTFAPYQGEAFEAFADFLAKNNIKFHILSTPIKTDMFARNLSAFSAGDPHYHTESSTNIVVRTAFGRIKSITMNHTEGVETKEYSAGNTHYVTIEDTNGIEKLLSIVGLKTSDSGNEAAEALAHKFKGCDNLSIFKDFLSSHGIEYQYS